MSEGINVLHPDCEALPAGSSKGITPVFPRVLLCFLRHWARPYLFRFADVMFWIFAVHAASLGGHGISLAHSARVQVVLGYLLPFTAFFLFQAAGCYRSWRTLDLFALLRPLVVATCGVSLIALVVAFAVKETGEMSRIWFATTVALSFSASAMMRITALAAQRWIRSNGYDLKNILVVSSGGMIKRLIELVNDNPGFGYKLVGVLGDRSPEHEKEGLEFLESSGSVNDYIIAREIDEVWIASNYEHKESVLPLLEQLQQTAVLVRWLPDISWLRILGCREESLMGEPSLLLNATAMDMTAGRIAKALFDRLFALCVLVALSPLLLLIALMVKLSSPGPVFFGQLRQGFSGKPFRCLKFRSMMTHAENGTVTQATPNDSRITPIGRFLRKSSLDELPQFINVLLGHMSVVGPRPHALQHNEFYRRQIDRYMQRHRAKPGITGWAQINGFRGETDTLDKMERRIEHDIHYMNNWSFWLDMKIIFRTALKGWSGHNAY